MIRPLWMIYKTSRCVCVLVCFISSLFNLGFFGGIDDLLCFLSALARLIRTITRYTDRTITVHTYHLHTQLLAGTKTWIRYDTTHYCIYYHEPTNLHTYEYSHDLTKHESGSNSLSVFTFCIGVRASLILSKIVFSQVQLEPRTSLFGDVA